MSFRYKYKIGRKKGKSKSINILGPGTYGGDSTVQRQVSTYGLNAANQDLAELGTAIPILFGSRQNSNGGFTSTPLMIYQRMYSKGSYEEVRIGFVCGEGGLNLDRPAHRGLRLGTDLLHSKQREFYSIRFTDGSTNNNDVTTSNTDAWGSKQVNPTAANNKFFCIHDSNGEIRGLSQTFDPEASFGLESEQPDCTQSHDPEFTILIPTPAPEASSLIKYSPVDASVGNTRSCRTTEFGFAVSMPQPAPVEDLGDGIAVGSKWIYRKNLQSPLGYQLCYSSYEPDFFGGKYYIPPVVATSKIFDDGTKVEIISADTAFYTIYRPFYKDNPKEELAKKYQDFLKQWGNKVFFIRYNRLPSPIYAMDASQFATDQTTYRSYFERIDGQFSSTNYGNLDFCENASFDPEALTDPRVPKLFFKVFYRKLDDNSSSWKPVTKKRFCLLSPDASKLFASLKIHHPGTGEQAYEYRFKAETPLQTETSSQAVYEKCKYGVKTSGGSSTVEDSLILYPTGQQEQHLTAEDGFKLTFDGLIESVQSEQKLDVQAESFDVSISYVNEFVEDPDVRYDYMSIGMLELRAGKGISGLSQLSMFYSDGAYIRTVEGKEESSYKFPDLCYYLLTQYPGDIAGPVDESLVDKFSFANANDYTKLKNLRYNGVITERAGIHEFINEHAKYFLLRFGTNNGRYTLYPALNDSVSNTPNAAPSQVVTLDILSPDSFSIDYATLAEREDTKMQVIWRNQERNMPGINESVVVQPIGYTGDSKVTYDISGFCTSKTHALTVARFLSAMRQDQDRVVSFSCADSAVDLAPGRLFKFDIFIETSRGNTYINNDQYQVTSRTYREDGTLDVRAVHMPAGITEKVFTDQEFEEVDS